MKTKKPPYIVTTGRRKTAVARVFMSPGKGDISINGQKPDEYFNTFNCIKKTFRPLELISATTSFDALIKVKGGGKVGQAGAISLGIARALLKHDENNRKVLRKNSLLTRDSRMVERKKYGQPGARKKFQFSKR